MTVALPCVLFAGFSLKVNNKRISAPVGADILLIKTKNPKSFDFGFAVVDDTRLELAERAKASSAAYPREWSRALTVTSSSCSILDETKNLQLKQVAGLWWTIQDSNL